MKKTLITLTALTLLLSLTACSGMGSRVDEPMTRDQSYTADRYGRTNEAGDNGRTTGSNATATNGTDTRAEEIARDDRLDREIGTVQDGSSAAARGVGRAVNRAGEVVDDVADGAADLVDDATDVVQDGVDSTTRRDALR